MIRTSQPGRNEGAITLSASRSRLRTRFRTTAPPSLRPVESPKRVSSRSVRRIRTTSRGSDLTDPCPCRAAKSSGLESMTSRGGLWPRSAVRPRASCGRGRGVRPALVVPRRSSSGHGSRVLWRDAASWAERSASSDDGYLSIRPRGSEYPERHANALGATRALQRVCRRIIGTRKQGCQTSGRPTALRRGRGNSHHLYSPGVYDSGPSETLPGPPGRCYSSAARGARQPSGHGPEGP
jgi:hypothetical protein